MESLWPIILLSLLFSALLTLVLSHNSAARLPPGPVAVPIIGNLLWLRRNFVDVEPLLRDLHSIYGPILTLRIGSRLAVFISDRRIAHKALVEHGAAFAGRPAPLPATRFLNSNQHNISSAAYGPLWRLLRRNLISEILHSHRVKLYSGGRSWVLSVLSRHLKDSSSADGTVVAVESFSFAMFCLLVLMCFGEKLDEKAIRDIEAAQRNLLLYARNLNVFSFAPAISRYIFRNRWTTAMGMRSKQKELFVPLIEARRQHKNQKRTHDSKEEEERFVYSYVDSLLDVELPEDGGRGLTDDEMVTLCSEFLTAGTDTTSTALQWIMAELVKHPEIQAKLFDEIQRVSEEGEVREEDLQRMPYLKAVILEGLRRHPPGHFVLPHAVTEEEVKIEGYVIPKNASINFMVAEMGRDEKVWTEPMEFRPERFLDGGEGEGVDITGTKEIRMMPFGAGRRICPGLGLAMLHLEYFVGNLVREFEWKEVEGEEVDLAEKPEFTIVMKHPLRARLIPRMRS